MAGHSQFKNIMYRKGAQDARKAKQFAKVIREITIATKSGLPDPSVNPRLRSAIVLARGINMPKDTIERAIKKASRGANGDDYSEARYEGYGPHGVAIIVEVLTDNRNRTASDIRAAFSKYGGALSGVNGVSFLFTRKGVIVFPLAVASEDDILDEAIKAGAGDVQSSTTQHEITCTVEQFPSVRDWLMGRFGDPVLARLEWRPVTVVILDEEAGRSVLKLMDVLEDNDDVQAVYANFDLPEDVLERLSV